MRRILWHGLMALMVVAGLAWAWANRLPADSQASAGGRPAPIAGHPAPDFTLATLDGGTFHLAAQRGRPVILNFWATWCPPCRAELPQLQAASRRLDGQVLIVGVDQAEPAGTVEAMAREVGLTYPLPLDDAGAISQQYAVRNLPTTFFIDRDGIIRQVQIGPLTEATLADLLRTIYP